MQTPSPFHPGELAVQARTGESPAADRNGRIIVDRIPNGALKFVDKQPMAVATSLDADRQLWVSLLAGKPGFARAMDPLLVNLDTDLLVSARNDIFWQNSGQHPFVGLLFIELSSRRRLKVNGKLTAKGSQYQLAVSESFALCPRYIQKREVEVSSPEELPADAPTFTGVSLTNELTRWIGHADTFFVGSAHDSEHLDASHRGGKPGFVQIEDSRTLLVPDYNGNSLFNTFGNLTINPNAGLLFIDFETGETLQLTGYADLIFGEPNTTDDTGGTGRHWRFHLQAWRRQASLRNVAWTFVEYSPFNV
jgi:uncharacterized protein